MADGINEQIARAVSRLGSGRADKRFRLSRADAEKEWKEHGHSNPGGGRGGSGGGLTLNTPGGGPSGARVPVRPVGGAPLQSGSVVDTFMEGPNNFAIERYQLNGADPDSSYTVHLIISLFVPNCSGQPITQPAPVQLTTNAQGNGQASIRVPPEFIPQIAKGQLNSIRWEFVRNGVVRYDTECVAIFEDLDESHGLEG